MNVYFYCSITAPAEELHEQKATIEDWLSGSKEVIQTIADRFLIDGGSLFPSLINSEPPFVSDYTLGEEVSLDLCFCFQYRNLSQAMLRIQLMTSLFQNLCENTSVYADFEYHLEED